MNRLRDDTGEDPVAEKGINLLRDTPSASPATDLKRRVWMSLQLTEARPSALPRMFRLSAPSRMKAFALVATIVCVAGTAGAVIVGRWIVPLRDPSLSSARPVDVKTTTKRRITERRAAGVTAAEPKILEPTAPQTHNPAPAKALTGRSVGAITGRAQRSSLPTPGPVSSGASPVSSGASLESTASIGAAGARERTEVLDAMVALRRDHDPVRAGALLDRYLAVHPQGALHEEALVLAIEAASGRGDHPSARRFARIYELDHPKGRFRQFAHSHVQSNAP